MYIILNKWLFLNNNLACCYNIHYSFDPPLAEYIILIFLAIAFKILMFLNL